MGSMFCVVFGGFSFLLNAWIIPRSDKIRVVFENRYIRNLDNDFKENIMRRENSSNKVFSTQSKYDSNKEKTLLVNKMSSSRNKFLTESPDYVKVKVDRNLSKLEQIQSSISQRLIEDHYKAKKTIKVVRQNKKSLF